MTDRITTVFVHVSIQALEVIVEDPFVAVLVSGELVGVGPTAEEGVTWIERSRGLVRLQKRLDGGIGVASTYPFTFPDRSDEVAVLAEQLVFLLPKGKDVVHGTTEESGMRFVALWETGRTPVPKTTVESVDGTGVSIETIDGIVSVRQRSDFAPVVSVLNRCVYEMGFPSQPFEGDG